MKKLVLRNVDNNRCTGHCCEMFYLPCSPEELIDAYNRWRYQDDTKIKEDSDSDEIDVLGSHHVCEIVPEDTKIYQDIHNIPARGLPPLMIDLCYMMI